MRALPQIALAAALVSCPALAQDVDAQTRACIDDNRQAQEAMLAEDFERALSKAEACASEQCAAALRSHCQDIKAQAQAKLPKPEPEPPAETEPPPLAPPRPPETESIAAPTASPPPPPPEDRDSDSAVLSYALGGVALVGAGSFAYFALSGRAKESELGCSPRCSDSQLDPITRDYLIADISLGVSVLALTGAILLWPSYNGDGPVGVAVTPRSVHVRHRF
jgi:hypothetical protein